MIHFFKENDQKLLALQLDGTLDRQQMERLEWLFSGALHVDRGTISGRYIGPRREMITPWSTNAVEICENCGIPGIRRIEEFRTNGPFDPMLHEYFEGLDQHLFELDRSPEPIRYIDDIYGYNEEEGLALSPEEVEYLSGIANEIGRPLTDSEVFGFSQINSEHCRHKIFNGTFIINGAEQERSLFQWIKKTAADHPNLIVSAYKDNVAFISGPLTEQFAPAVQDRPDFFTISDFESVISLKAETHNFPTTVEPFNGAATGSGGEIRDRLAGGQGSFPLAGTAVYMTSYPRSKANRTWEKDLSPRKWLYQSPKDILIKASDGASDFGNKFGQPLISGSLLTFEHEEHDQHLGFDKVIMLAGGVGFARREASKKQSVSAGEKIVVLGGDNYRIGMGGGAVSSVATGEFGNTIELNAVQRSNPEMQKRVANAIRAMAEAAKNPLVSIHDHGAGGHLNCLSELVEETGGKFDLRKFPVGDPTLSEKEILSNESQERMGMVVRADDIDYLQKVSERERAPFYEVGEATGDGKLLFATKDSTPFALDLSHLFGSSPRTILRDDEETRSYGEVPCDERIFDTDLQDVLQLEAVACKDWLTNKVDRSVTGKVATQQTVGEIQLPLNNVAVMALDFKHLKGIATSIGHAPVAATINAGAGSRLSVAEALTNLVFAPLSHGLKGVSLSANWMWPANNPGENARLYQAVRELSECCSALGVNVPTGKDSLSMTQKYPDGKRVISPGTVIVSSVAEVEDIRKTILPAIDPSIAESRIIYVDCSGGEFALGGSSFAQTKNKLGSRTPNVDPGVLKSSFEAIQEVIKAGHVIAGHDVSSGGLITTLLEMNFPNSRGGMQIDLSAFSEENVMKILFSEKPGIVLQVTSNGVEQLTTMSAPFITIGTVSSDRVLSIKKGGFSKQLDIDTYRDIWMQSSFELDKDQSHPPYAEHRFANYKTQPLTYQFPKDYDGRLDGHGIDLNRKKASGLRAAIIREKGVNGDREMAYALWMAGFDVKDVHMTDLVSGREDLVDIQMIVFVGGFSNSDVLGSAKGWAGSFMFNEKARNTLNRFYDREDTLSLGVCNGCQVMMELEKVYPDHQEHPKMHHNGSGKFESAFVNVDIVPNNTVMFGSMAGSKLGIWLAHGEGRFRLPLTEHEYHIPIKYTYNDFPGNANDSDFATAAVSSKDGRHVAIMPHLERSMFPWNWAHYEDKMAHEVSPWIIPFVNARKWIADHTQFRSNA